jgi:hypothetical protein
MWRRGRVTRGKRAAGSGSHPSCTESPLTFLGHHAIPLGHRPLPSGAVAATSQVWFGSSVPRISEAGDLHESRPSPPLFWPLGSATILVQSLCPTRHAKTVRSLLRGIPLSVVDNLKGGGWKKVISKHDFMSCCFRVLQDPTDETRPPKLPGVGTTWKVCIQHLPP